MIVTLMREGESSHPLAWLLGRPVVLQRWRAGLGFYDSYRSDYPFSYLLSNASWGLLDSPGHRAVAREVAAKSTVLLKNLPPVLPLGKPKSIAVIGPFAACSGPQKGYGPASNNSDPRYLTALEGSCYLHS